MPPAQGTVRALEPESRAHFRRVLAAEWVRDRFAVVPSVFVVLGVVLGLVVTHVDAIPGLRGLVDRVPVTPGAAETILSIIASAMLTFVGVVFTISLVALQLASAQLSPRVLRTFVRSSVTKVAFGCFLATFAYAMVVLVAEAPSSSSDVVLRGAVTVGLWLVSASLAAFVVYVTHTMRLLQVSWVITAVGDETRDAIAKTHPPESAYVTATAPVATERPRLVRLALERDDGRGGELGFVLGIDRGRLVQLASRHGCVLQVLPRVGDYLPTGAPVVEVHGGAGREAPADADVRRCLLLGRTRTLYQDALYGLRQLVDVATQALSPAVNQPTTAVEVIHRIEDVLLRIARRPVPTGLYVDGSGIVRLVEHQPTWAETVDLAFIEITAYGSASPAVSARLAATLDRLRREVRSDLQGDVARHAAALDRILVPTAATPGPSRPDQALDPSRTPGSGWWHN